MKNRCADATLVWLLSAGIHVALLLGTALVFVEQLLATDNDATIICAFPGQPPRIDPDLARDVFEHKGVASKEGQRFDPFDESTFSPDSRETWLPGLDLIPTDDAPTHRSSLPSTLAISEKRLRRASEDRSSVLRPRLHGGCPITRVLCGIG
jgi:hypothetical protein